MDPLNAHASKCLFTTILRGGLKLFLWLILLAQVQGTPLKHIGKVRMLRIIPAGSSVDLSCELNHPSVPVYLWQMLPSGSMYTPRENVAKYGQVFTLHHSSKSAQGFYFCGARGHDGRPFRKWIGKVSVSAPPKDPPIPVVNKKYKVTLVGRDVNLTCQATGTKIATVYWYKNATKLFSQLQYIRQEPTASREIWKNTLMLKRVNNSARGFYECRVFETGQDLAFWAAHVKLSVLAETECPELDGTFVDPHSKTGYLLCKGGVSTKMNCSKGLAWNDKKKACDIAAKAKVIKWKTHGSLSRMAKTIGDSVVFDCRLTDPGIRVKLKQKVSTGVIAERVVDGCKISLVGQIFLLHAANFDDIGIYFCSASQTNVRPKPIKELAFLKIHPGLFSAFPQGTRNLMVSIGSSVDLNCEAYSVPQPLLSLELLSVDGTTVLNPDGQKVTLTGRVFTIHQLEENMKGQVVCRVMSSCSDRRTELELGFLLPVPPRGIALTPKVFPSYSNSQEGTTVRIKCTLSGGNSQSVEWYKNKRKVAAPDSGSELELKNISMSDAGNYECRVMDFGVGYLAATAVVNITAGRGPGGSSVTISPFESTDIVCGSRQDDIDVTLWQKPKSRSDVIQRVPDGEELIRQGSVFTISQGQHSDEGKYYCQFEDQRRLPVLDLSILGLTLPNKAILIPNGESKTIDYLGGVNLICVVQSSQPPNWITWLKFETSGRVHNITNHKITKTQMHGHQSQLVLHVRNATDTDTGTYICRVQFGDEIRENSLRLKVKNLTIPKVLSSSGSLVVKETQKAELWCAFDGSPQARVIWKKNGRDLGECSPRWGAMNCNATSKRHNISFSNGTVFLRFTEVIYYQDHGMYTCHLENMAGIANNTLKLTVQVEPHITKNSTDNLLVIGANESATLRCSIEHSNPTASKSWWHRPCPMDIATCRNSSHGWKRLFVTNTTSSSELLVVPVDTQHALYKCVAENLLGSDYVLYSIVRLDTRTPKIWNFTSTTHVKASQNAGLLCMVEGKPLPDVEWTKNGVSVGKCKGDVQEKTKICSVVSGIGKYQLFWKGSGAELVIHKAFHPFDAGEFTCLAKNVAGIDKKTVTLIIHEKPVINKLDKRKFHVLSFEAAATLESHALRGYPPPYFSWFHQPIRLCTTGCKPNSKKWRRVPRSVVNPPNRVPSRISSLFVPPSKSGFFYRCIAENNLGRDDVLFSVHRVDTQSFLPQIVSPPSGLRVDEDSSLTLQCRASNWDFLYLTWKRRNGRRISSEVTIGEHNITSIVTIEKIRPDEAGDYLCVGWTANDTKSSMVTVSVTKFSSPVVSLVGTQQIHEAKTNKTIMRCVTTSGYPRPNITWYRNGVELNLNAIGSEDDCRMNGFHYMEDHRPPHAEYLVLCKPNHVHNTGFYRCSAKNKKGANSSQGFLNVLANPKIINIDDRRLPLGLGKKLNVSCKATGNPAPTVKWVRMTSRSGRVPIPLREGNINNNNNNTIFINSIQEKHYGDYACIAENTFGNDTVVFAVVKPASAKAAQKAPSLESSLLALVVVGAAMFLLLMIIAAILYNRRKLYGGLYICSSPPLPDLIPRLDPGISLLDQVNKLPYEKRWEFPREHLHLDKIIGSGAFGEVYLAEADGSLISDTSSAVNVRHRLSTTRDSRRSSAMSVRGSIRVAVKTLKEGADEMEHKDLLSELKILIHIGSHKNIVNLLGACTKGRLCDLCVIIEYCQYGSMLHFLRARREIYKPTWLPPTEQPDEQYTLTDLVSAAFQVARAMEFLVSRKCIHRDLAARNVLVAANYVVKVADFGLARDVYKDDKYVKISSGLVPVKWMAIESLTDRVYSEQSDVWSFGIFLWELFTLGGSPYPSLPPTEVYQYLKEGNRMECPVDCPDEMYCIMVDCWMEKPEDRPNFTALVQRLDHTIESNIVAMGREAYLELGSEPIEETDANGYLKPIDVAVSSLNHSAMRDGKISSSDRDLRARAQPGANNELLLHERYTELGFKPTGSMDIAETTKL